MSETRPADDISDDFVRENRQHVRTLVESLVAMGETADRETVDEAFRAAHSLKANCELVGLDDAGAVAHAVEDVLAAARAGDLTVDEPTADEAAAAVEAIERVLDGISDADGIPTIDAEGWATRLRGRLDDGATTDAATATAEGETIADEETTTTDDADPAPDLDDLGLDEEARAAFEAAGDYDDLDELVAAMEDDDAEAYADLEGAGSFDELEAAAEAEGEPEPAPSDAQGPGDAATAAEPSDSPTGSAETDTTATTDAEADSGVAPASDPSRPGRARPDQSSDDPPAPDPDVAPLTTGAPDVADADEPSSGVAIPGLGQPPDAAATIAGSSLDAERFAIDPDEAAREPRPASEPLGAIRSLAVEWRRLAAALDDDLGDDLDGRAADSLASLRVATDVLGGTVADDLRRLDALAPALERAVERAARHVETPVAFTADIAPVAVDREIADRLSDPLVHCVRNAVDHGIEAPRERGAAGKPEAGTVTVRGRRDGERLVVTVRDDGRGIDADAVREAAVAAGIEGAADATDDEALDLLFEAGLSTADADSDVSGRGVGMDVVGRAMSDLDGEVTVDSTPGEGTTVRLSVPVDAVVEHVRLVAAGTETYAVPRHAVAEVVPASEARVQNGAVQVSAGELERDAMGTETAFGSTVDYPTVDIGRALEAPNAGPTGGDEPAYLLLDPGGSASGGNDAAARAGDGPSRAALRCDGVLGEHETLVTPLPGIDASPAVDGAVVCDAGRVVPVLDPGAFTGGQ